jgi:hypothetical protein
MSLIDGKSWWEENQTRTRQLFATCFLVAFAFVVTLFYSDIKEFFSSHHWWEDTLVVLAGIAVPILAYFELRHSGEANDLRREANRLRAEEVRLQDMIGELTAENTVHLAHIAELERERNEHLAHIVTNTQRPVTQADRNAQILRKHLRANVSVSEGKGVWGNSPEIVEVNNHIVTLFCARTPSSSVAWCTQVHCDDLEITEIPQDSCPLRVKINKRYGPDVQLGEITKWEDRLQAAAVPAFDKGGTVYHATFSKPGYSETRSLYVFASKDGRNSFLLETGAGEKVIADNVEISKRFAIFEVDYRAEGFNRKSVRHGCQPVSTLHSFVDEESVVRFERD